MIDIKTLEQISSLRSEIDDLKERLSRMERERTVIDSVQGSGTSYPYILHHCTIEGVEYPRRNNKQKRKLKKLEFFQKMLHMYYQKYLFNQL